MIAVRFTADEKAEIIAAAVRNRVYPSGFLATAGLSAARGSTTPLDSNDQLDATIDELVALRAQISRVGNNINQIAYIYNAGGQPRPGQLDHALKTLLRTLAQVDAVAHALVRKRV
ncbi:plasmid mobilization relaxosome protein MobC [Streptomyces caeni]|uniref:Plasmid mobilization relaxosome protein MobC n=1 Tax=Streptomyces caeni TaxID=2307231 RepID=A0ABW4IS38_9ACTN